MASKQDVVKAKAKAKPKKAAKRAVKKAKPAKKKKKKLAAPSPDVTEESLLWAENEAIVFGVDEAGRGCLAARSVFPPK
jgi:hypothetical protein